MSDTPRIDYTTPMVRSVRNGTRVCLIGLAWFTLGRALAYNPFFPTTVRERPPVTVQQLIEGGVPLSVWAAGWIVAFLIVFLGIFRPRLWTTLPLVAMCAIWAVAYGVGWLRGISPTGYIYLLTYTSIASVILGGGFLAGRALALAVVHDKAIR